jgi:hypothetical protein
MTSVKSCFLHQTRTVKLTLASTSLLVLPYYPRSCAVEGTGCFARGMTLNIAFGCRKSDVFCPENTWPGRPLPLTFGPNSL